MNDHLNTNTKSTDTKPDETDAMESPPVEPMALMDTMTNRDKIRLIETTLRTVYDTTLQRGFYGTVNVEFCVQDGTIQSVLTTTEKSVR